MESVIFNKDADAITNDNKTISVLNEYWGISNLATVFADLKPEQFHLHPLCVDCAKVLSDELTKQLSELRNENNRYNEVLTQLQSTNTIQSVDAVEQSLQELEHQERRLIEQLEKISEERKKYG